MNTDNLHKYLEVCGCSTFEDKAQKFAGEVTLRGKKG
jgi:hypothetical protein